MEQMVQDELKNKHSSRGMPLNTANSKRGQPGTSFPIIKSPSDMTLYHPALKKLKDTDDIINKISNFVEDQW